MSRKNPYGLNNNFNPDEILNNARAQQSEARAEAGSEAEAGAEVSPPPVMDAPEAGPDPAGPGLTDPAKEKARSVCPQEKAAEDARLRALAEVDNIRKRMIREKEEAIKFAASNVLCDILPALDNLDLALEHARGQEANKDLLVGVEMTRKLLLDALKKHGLEVVGQVGEEFDPAFHEAMGLSPSPDVDNGAICNILNKGYKLRERLLRPARVIVCKK